MRHGAAVVGVDLRRRILAQAETRIRQRARLRHERDHATVARNGRRTAYAVGLRAGRRIDVDAFGVQRRGVRELQRRDGKKCKKILRHDATSSMNGVYSNPAAKIASSVNSVTRFSSGFPTASWRDAEA